jgi:hypothetical protein
MKLGSDHRGESIDQSWSTLKPLNIHVNKLVQEDNLELDMAAVNPFLNYKVKCMGPLEAYNSKLDEIHNRVKNRSALSLIKPRVVFDELL